MTTALSLSLPLLVTLLPWPNAKQQLLGCLPVTSAIVGYITANLSFLAAFLSSLPRLFTSQPVSAPSSDYWAALKGSGSSSRRAAVAWGVLPATAAGPRRS